MPSSDAGRRASRSGALGATTSADAGRQARTPGAYAIVKTDPPQLLLAENAAVISRLIAVEVVARHDPRLLPAGQAAVIRDALLEERWADAVVAWMGATDTFVDVYEEYVPVWTEEDLDSDRASMEIRVARMFDDHRDIR